MNSEKLRDAMKIKGFSIREMAKALGYGYSHLYYKVIGKKDCTISDVNRISDFLKLTKKERLDIFLS